MNKEIEINCYSFQAGRDGSVGIATRYRLDGSGIESRKGRDFPHPSRSVLGPSYTMGTRSLSGGGGGVKPPGRGADNVPHLAPRLKKELS